jgi:hypothetical protein
MALPVSSPIPPIHYQRQQQVEIPLSPSAATSSHPPPPSAFSPSLSAHQRTRAALPNRSGSLPPFASASSSSSHRPTVFQLHSASTSTPITVRKPNREPERSSSRTRSSPPKPALSRLQTSSAGSSGLNRVSTATASTSSSTTTSSSSHSGHQSQSMNRSAREREAALCLRPLPPPPPPLTQTPKLSLETRNLKQPTRKRASTVDVPPAALSLPTSPIEPPQIHVTTVSCIYSVFSKFSCVSL